AEGEAHAFDRSVDVCGDRHVEAGRFLEDKRGPASRRLAGAIDDRRDLEMGADRIGYPREELAAIEIGEEVIEIAVHKRAQPRKHDGKLGFLRIFVSSWSHFSG